MLLFGIFSFIFVLVAIIIIGFRFFVDYKLKSIQQEENQSTLFKKKVSYIKKIEQGKHINYLLITCLILSVGVISLTMAFMILQSNYQKEKTELNNLKNQITSVEEAQQQLIKNVPLMNYPTNGIGLKDYDWKSLFSNQKDSKLQSKVESDISQKVVQYFGLSNISIALDIPKKTLAINLNGQTDSTASKDTIKENVEMFVEEAKDIPGLTQIHITLVTAVGKANKVVYSANYTRNNDQESFEKTNDSERNVKREGGKG